jgi:gluconolactonase
MPEISRRTFLRASSCTAIAYGAGRLAIHGAAQEPDRYSGLKSADYLGEIKIEVTLDSQKPFTEGPAVDAEGNVFFTNIPNPQNGQILKWHPKEKRLSVFREKTNAANGLNFDAQGRLVACEGGLNDRGRVTRTDMAAGEITVLCDSYNGKPLGAPNDNIIDAKGRIYFTSRLANTDPQAGNVNSVYRIDPDGRVAQILAAPEIDMPNGVELSPDQKTLYLVESDGCANRARMIRAYDLHITFYPGRSGDGLTVDREGNLYIAAGLHKPRGTSETLDTKPGIHVFSPQGKLLAFAETPEDTITNCTFGGEDGKTLYITCGRFLLSCRTRIAGH